MESMSKINTHLKWPFYAFFSQEIAKYVNRALQEKKLLYFGMANLDFKFSDPVYALTAHLLFSFIKLPKKGLIISLSVFLCHQDLWTPEDVVPESLRETWR